MKIEEQVLSIEQMKHLQEFGVDTSDASMYWVRAKRIIGKQRNSVLDNEMGKWRLSLSKNIVHSVDWAVESVPTYTAGDLFRKLPPSLKCDYLDSWIAIHSDGSDDPLISASYEFEYNNNKGKQVGDTIEEALYKLLCWVAENHKELLEVKND